MFQTCPNPALESGTGSGLPMRGQSPHGAGAAGAPLLFIRSGRVNRPGVKVSPEAKRLVSRLTTTVTVSAPAPSPALESGTDSGLPVRGQSPHGAGAAGAPLLFIRSGRVNRPGVKVSPEAKRLVSRLTTMVTVSAPAPSPVPESGTGSGRLMRGQSPHSAGAAGAPLLFIRSGRVNRPGVKVSPEAKRLVSRLTTSSSARGE